jgi:cephalosporin-C deacetylase-like acetyl esterase
VAMTIFPGPPGVLAKVWACALLLSVAPSGGAFAQPSSPPTGRAELTAYIDGLARDNLAVRAVQVAELKTQAEAEARKARTKATFLNLIGGLPLTRTPLAAKAYGVIQEDGFKVEKITYDSLPGYHVTANVYVPTGQGAGPFPAVIVAPGHGLDGKIGNRGFAVNLARAGMIVLAYDIVSEGERLQHYDPELGASKVGRPTGEHSLAAWQTAAVGDHVSRYFIWDAVRGLDYLAARPDVDAQRLGAFGCSGGGTVTAFLSALDERVKATATACYVTDFDHLLSTVGPQDGEQSIPGFLASGLDIADLVEMAAPRPYAVISTTEDMFPFAGAKKAVDEIKGVYGLYGAQDRLSWIYGPGGHGALAPISSDIVAFFTRWLKNEPDKRPFLAPPRLSPDALLVTPTGQISTSIGGETIQTLNAARARQVSAKRPVVASRADLAVLRARLKTDIRAVTFARAQPGGAPPEAVEGANGALRLKVADGQAVDAILTRPQEGGRRPAVLLLTSQPQAIRGEAARLAKAGHVVLTLAARGAGGTEEIKAAVLGDWNLLATRALLVNKTPLGLRLDDAVRAMDWLAARPDVDPTAISVYGIGPLGPVALHLGAIDERVAAIYADGGLTAYRMAVDQPIQRDLPEVLPPGVLRRYELADLALAAFPRLVTFVNPVDAVGVPLKEVEFDKALALVRAADRKLGQLDQVRWTWRGGRDPLPLP